MNERPVVCLLSLVVAAAAADLPVREVVLYKHGVGYFERSGRLGAGESARLDFKAEEMNDVLKSLTIDEKGGGKISGLRYDSSEPLAKKLGEFPFAHGQPAAAERGARSVEGRAHRAEVRHGDGGGRDCGGAPDSAGDKNQPEREQVTLLMDSGEMRNFDLGAATSMRFTDPTLQLQFKDYLGGADAGALEGKAQRLHRFHRLEGARDLGQLHDPDAGVEIELPADLRRKRAAHARRLGDCRQHHGR